MLCLLPHVHACHFLQGHVDTLQLSDATGTTFALHPKPTLLFSKVISHVQLPPLTDQDVYGCVGHPCGMWIRENVANVKQVPQFYKSETRGGTMQVNLISGFCFLIS